LYDPTSWPLVGQFFEDINCALAQMPIGDAQVIVPGAASVALLLLWLLIRLLRQRKPKVVAPRKIKAKAQTAAVAVEEEEGELSDEEIEAQLLDEQAAAEPLAEEEFVAAEEAEAEPVVAPPPEPVAPAAEPPALAEVAAEAAEKAPAVEEAAEEAVPEPITAPKISLFARLRRGLSKTAGGLVGRVDKLIRGRRIDAAFFDELEEILFTADLGPATADKLLTILRERVRQEKIEDAAAIRTILKDEIKRILTPHQAALDVAAAKPFVVMVVGVNGVGKTTTIGKLANMVVKDGRTVIMGAADTFRAAADEQLTIWAERVEAEIVKQKSGAAPAAVAFDTVQAAVNRAVDVVIVDTAGRLHTKHNLMEELKKVQRVMKKVQAAAPHEVLLVLDANTGQNAIAQAKTFHEALGLTGFIITKLDGTAKGGCIVGICDELAVPVRYIGIGERMDDLRPFVADDFVEALFEAAEG